MLYINYVNIITTIMILKAGAFMMDTNETKSQIGIKNVKLYKSPKWLYCYIKIHNVSHKCIHANELQDDISYCIEITTCDNMHSLLCNNMIIYQQPRLFEYKIEFIMSDTDTMGVDTMCVDDSVADDIYSYIVKPFA